KPLLYLSIFFEKNKQLYYDNLTRVRTKNDMLQWLKYFMVGIEQTASLAIGTLTKVLQLQEHIRKTIQENFGRRIASGLTLINYLFQFPSVRVEDVARVCNLSFKAAGDLTARMVEEGWLKEITGQSRNRRYMFVPYIEAFKG
ncbi:MAG: Fic family protein, partial [Saprospiraceae bacterium]